MLTMASVLKVSQHEDDNREDESNSYDEENAGDDSEDSASYRKG